jgi:dihydroxyacetone kinase-like protein
MNSDVFRAWITAATAVIQANRDHLTQLDAAIGDADHGTNLSRGFTAVAAALAKAAEAGEPAGDALTAMADAARAGAEATIPLLALKGRASYLGSRSVGHEDPGAASTALILTALRDTVAGGEADRGDGP